jgi:dynein regulatory complex protein 1
LPSFAEIKAALKAKDEEYVKLLKSQADDLDTLLSHCTAQLEQLTAAYREELAAIEAVLMQVIM